MTIFSDSTDMLAPRRKLPSPMRFTRSNECERQPMALLSIRAPTTRNNRQSKRNRRKTLPIARIVKIVSRSVRETRIDGSLRFGQRLRTGHAAAWRHRITKGRPCSQDARHWSSCGLLGVRGNVRDCGFVCDNISAYCVVGPPRSQGRPSTEWEVCWESLDVNPSRPVAGTESGSSLTSDRAAAGAGQSH